MYDTWCIEYKLTCDSETKLTVTYLHILLHGCDVSDSVPAREQEFIVKEKKTTVRIVLSQLLLSFNDNDREQKNLQLSGKAKIKYT